MAPQKAVYLRRRSNIGASRRTPRRVDDGKPKALKPEVKSNQRILMSLSVPMNAAMRGLKN